MGEERSSVVMSGGCVKAVLRAEHTATDSSDNDITDGRQVTDWHCNDTICTTVSFMYKWLAT